MTRSTTLTPRLLQRFSPEEQAIIKRADEYATQAHQGQRRKSGQPYITHPRAVARYLIELGMDAPTVAAGLLHDVVEDTPVRAEDIEHNFGSTIRMLVEGVTKLGEVEYVQSDDDSWRRANSIENLRKLLLAMSADLRVLVIKLADRLHNLKTLNPLAPADRQRIAQESLDVFAPLADRLGMGMLKAEMEDLAFRYAHPVSYRLVKRLVTTGVAASAPEIEALQKEVERLLRQQNVTPISVHGRQKHLYSVYRKLAKTEGDISKIYDLVALRVIVPTVADCYQVLGILHQHYRPLIYRIKDYIAVPKPNGYRSLHTTVFAGHGHIIEIQIRTAEMHSGAEQGMAAHAIYNAGKATKEYRAGRSAPVNDKLTWLRELAELNIGGSAGQELMDALQLDLFGDRIFIFSPKGDLYDLPEGATPIDFAFAIHSDLGLRLQGARVNGQMVALDRALENRDVVEIITKKLPGPNRQWLGTVKTARARNRIKSWFRATGREANIIDGRRLIESRLEAWGLKRFEEIPAAEVRRTCDSLNLRDTDALLAAVGDGTVALATVLRRLLPPRSPRAAKPAGAPALPSFGPPQVIGAPELPCYIAACCQPQAPEAIIGYITRGSGVTVHRQGCANIPQEPDRLLNCRWDAGGPSHELLSERLRLVCQNQLGLVHRITGVILDNRINIVEITTQDPNQDQQEAVLWVTVEVPTLFELSALIQALRAQAAVRTVTRVASGTDRRVLLPDAE
jgi:guanosine-3',5'-bis(diphosphate) 3'-pyrophosphohydrolase